MLGPAERKQPAGRRRKGGRRLIATHGRCAGSRSPGRHDPGGQHRRRGEGTAGPRRRWADQKREEADVGGRHTDVDEQSRHPSDKLHNLAGADTTLNRSPASVGTVPPSACRPPSAPRIGAVARPGWETGAWAREKVGGGGHVDEAAGFGRKAHPSRLTLRYSARAGAPAPARKLASVTTLPNTHSHEPRVAEERHCMNNHGAAGPPAGRKQKYFECSRCRITIPFHYQGRQPPFAPQMMSPLPAA